MPDLSDNVSDPAADCKPPIRAWPTWAEIGTDGLLILHCAEALDDPQLVAANAATFGACLKMLMVRTCASALPRNMLLDLAMSSVEENRAGVQEVVERLMPEPALMAPWSSAGAA